MGAINRAPSRAQTERRHTHHGQRWFDHDAGREQQNGATFHVANCSPARRVGILICLVWACAGEWRARAGWVDPDTPSNAMGKEFYGRQYELVFSDEFDREGRTFEDGSDPRWTALNKNDYTNAALQYYSEKLVRKECCFVFINP